MMEQAYNKFYLITECLNAMKCENTEKTFKKILYSVITKSLAVSIVPRVWSEVLYQTTISLFFNFEDFSNNPI